MKASCRQNKRALIELDLPRDLAVGGLQHLEHRHARW